MTKKIKIYLFFITISQFLLGCLSLPTIQSGKIVGKNNFEIGLNGSYGKYSQNSVLDREGNFDNKPVIGLRGQYGISEKQDIGINIDQNSFIGATFKQQFVGNQTSKFASSIGLGSSFNFGAFLFGNLTYYVTVPLFISVHPKNNFSIYLTPRYVYSSEYVFAHPTGGQLGVGDQQSFIGNSYGLILGNKHKISIELSNYGRFLYKPTQFSLGYCYTFGQ